MKENRLAEISPAAFARTGTRGMTLVEIMIVLTIMASIAAVVGFFAKGALEAVQLDVSRLHKGRLLNAAEFNIACMRSCVEEIRNEKKNKDFVKWITDPLLLEDPLRPKSGLCSVA